ITSDVEEGITLHFNATQLQRIIDNNISNAIKYSHEQSKIEVTFRRDGELCSLIFKDDGFGIEDTARIFERYYREETGKGGFGIGLDIVKSIMDETGIELAVQSTPKEGSTFIYTFPSSLCR
ncbi:MAG: ATP-binding protein, partial [Thiovulaceae bacterium]|nr:ATP-binding protein [Sulfurimonadaceae bacterium]